MHTYTGDPTNGITTAGQLPDDGLDKVKAADVNPLFAALFDNDAAFNARTDVQVYEELIGSSQLWTKPAWCSDVPNATTEILCIAPGGGGGSGAAGANSSGGGGGGGGEVVRRIVRTSALGATEPVIVSGRGTGGEAVDGSGGDVTGNDGTDGGFAIFGSVCAATGGKKGLGGVLVAGTATGGAGGGAAGSTGKGGKGGDGKPGATAATDADTDTLGAPGGGAGGGTTSGGTSKAGSDGGCPLNDTTGVRRTGGASAGLAGQSAVAGYDWPGKSAGGGAGGYATAPGAAGATAGYGVGGAGGGGAHSLGTSAAGADGAPGLVIVITKP